MIVNVYFKGLLDVLNMTRCSAVFEVMKCTVWMMLHANSSLGKELNSSYNPVRMKENIVCEIFCIF